MTTVFIEPCDIVFFRDDLPFGAEGNQVARCQFPPRPSVIAGALRTRVMVDQGVDFDVFAAGGALPEAVSREIGRVRRDSREGRDGWVESGSFRLAGLTLGHVGSDGTAKLFFRVGRDLVAEGKRGTEGRTRALAPAGSSRLPARSALLTLTRSARLLAPATNRRLPGTSSVSPLTPIAVAPGMTPVDGWLEAQAYVRYLAGEAPASASRIRRESQVLDWDHRVGIGMDPGARTVDEGRLFSSRGAVLRPGWVLVATIEECSLLPTSGLVRLGGDGRMARLGPWPASDVDWAPARQAVTSSERFRWVLQTPAIFGAGWLPDAVRKEGGDLVYERDGFRARLMSAVVGAPELAGGWDLVRRGPKPFRLMVPAGSVYWFEVVSGSGEDAWRLFHGRSVSDEKASEGFGIVHVGGWSHV